MKNSKVIKKKKNAIDWAFVGSSPDSVSELVDTLSSVDLNSPEAEANATSISDNNGGRIELDEDPPIKK